MRSMSFRLLAVLLLSALMSTPAAPPAAAVPAHVPEARPAADAAPVQFLRDLPDIGPSINDATAWLVGGGYLYWARCQYIISSVPQSTAARPDAGYAGYLRRWPLRGGRVVTITDKAFCNSDSWAADASGLYYWENGYIYRRTVSDPATATPVVTTAQPTGALVLDGDTLFYIVGTSIYSTPKWQTVNPDPRYDETEYIVETGANGSGLIVNGGSLTWFGGGRVRSIPKTCQNNCTPSNLAIENGAYLSAASISGPLLGSSTNPLWVSGPLQTITGQTYAGNEIRGYYCSFIIGGPSCNAGNVYTAPNRADSNGVTRPATIGPLATDGHYLFWVENLKICSTGPLGIYCSTSDAGRLMKYNIRRSIIGQPDQFDNPQPIATKNSSGAFAINGTPNVAVVDGWVYFDTSNSVSRIRADAPPISWDLAFSAWEVTQGIQNLNNDVPLVASKPTYVRLYGTKLNGPDAYGVEAQLLGQTGSGANLGVLRPLNGAQTFNTKNAAPNRGTITGSWLFQLPASWLNAGTLRLRASIDPRGVWNDPNRANNINGYQAFTLTRKAPVCIVTIPVRTHGPAASNTSPNVFFARDMVRRLWPVSDVWLYHQDDDIAELQARFGIPPWEYGPYEIPEDTWKMLVSLTERDLFSDDPDRCDDAGARTHYVGIVSPQTPTGDADVDAGTNGSGRVGYDQAWVKLPRDDFDRFDYRGVRVATLPHELAHNYERKHVNCGGPDDPDPDYPYKAADGTACTLDNRDQSAPTTYFGFDVKSQTPIAPTAARDLLAYTCNNPTTCTPRWSSDYTWRGLFNGVKSTAVLASDPAAQGGQVPQLATAANVVLVTGIISPTANQGALSYGWVYPTNAVGRTLIRKWQAHAAPAATQARADTPNYHVQVVAADGTVLDDRAVTLVHSDLHSDMPAHTPAPDEAATFALTFPAPASAVARLLLLQDSTVLASLSPGSSAPLVSILSPAGGETVDNHLTLSWRASDPDNDKLLFTVQYSPDNGQTWRALLTGIPSPSNGDTTTLNLDALTGIPASTTGGLIRVAASDGYNTTLAVSQPFTVVNRAPQPYIDSPGGSAMSAGQTVALHGGATDPEDGGLADSALRWTLNGAEIGTGAQQTLEGLAPGSYTLALTARDSAGREGTTSTTLTVAPLVVPLAVAPVLDGTCDDAAYASAARIPLAPYTDGSNGQAFVQLVRTGEALYACFVGMQRTGGTSPGTFAILRADTDYTRKNAVGPNDHAFLLDESGVLSTYNGNGSGYVRWSGSAQGQVSANDTTWSAEMRVDASALGGMNHVIGLAAEQAWVRSNSDRFPWPHRSALEKPGTWATTLLGDAVRINSVVPPALPVGSGDSVVTVQGSGFANGATVLWNGAARPTTVISSTAARVTLSAADLATAGTFSMTAANAGLEAAPANSVPFDVLNPVPQIAQAGLAGRTLVVAGSSFAPGATVQFNGVAHPATSSGGLLQATLTDLELLVADGAEVTVLNPGPGGGVSNVAVLRAAAPAPGGRWLYLPLTQR
jgi:hypothetical protein